jgi:plasmid stability protein
MTEPKRPDPFGALAVTVAPGVDLTEPTGEVWEAAEDLPPEEVIAEVTPPGEDAIISDSIPDEESDQASAMSDLLIRDVDERLVRTLKCKAEINGTSLQQEAKRALTRGAPLTGDERGRLLEQFARENGGFPKVKTSGGDLVGDMREDEG